MRPEGPPNRQLRCRRKKMSLTREEDRQKAMATGTGVGARACSISSSAGVRASSGSSSADCREEDAELEQQQLAALRRCRGSTPCRHQESESKRSNMRGLCVAFRARMPPGRSPCRVRQLSGGACTRGGNTLWCLLEKIGSENSSGLLAPRCF